MLFRSVDIDGHIFDYETLSNFFGHYDVIWQMERYPVNSKFNHKSCAGGFMGESAWETITLSDYHQESFYKIQSYLLDKGLLHKGNRMLSYKVKDKENFYNLFNELKRLQEITDNLEENEAQLKRDAKLNLILYETES